MVISEIYFQCSGFVQSIYVDNPVLSEGLFGGTENLLYISFLIPFFFQMGLSFFVSHHFLLKIHIWSENPLYFFRIWIWCKLIMCETRRNSQIYSPKPPKRKVVIWFFNLFFFDVYILFGISLSLRCADLQNAAIFLAVFI